MSQPIVATRLIVTFDPDFKGVTVTGVNGNSVRRRAAVTMNVSFRKDGGVTIWGDGECTDQTLRLDSYGRTIRSKRAPKH